MGEVTVIAKYIIWSTQYCSQPNVAWHGVCCPLIWRSIVKVSMISPTLQKNIVVGQDPLQSCWNPLPSGLLFHDSMVCLKECKSQECQAFVNAGTYVSPVTNVCLMHSNIDNEIRGIGWYWGIGGVTCLVWGVDRLLQRTTLLLTSSRRFCLLLFKARLWHAWTLPHHASHAFAFLNRHCAMRMHWLYLDVWLVQHHRMVSYERRSKTHLFLVSDRISKADFECALTAVAKGSRRSCERSAQVMLVTWPRCKNNCSSDFRLLFPGLGKSKLEIWNNFAFSRAGKKQIGSLSLLLFPGLGKSKLEVWTILLFPGPGKSKLEVWANWPDWAVSCSWRVGQSKWLGWKSWPFCFFPAREKANWKSRSFCFFPAREKANWKSEQTGLTEPSLVHGGLRPTKNTPAWKWLGWKSWPFCFFPARAKANWKSRL